ncbi:MAG: glycosyltransferase family 4 protein [Beijerinckiaceae bacterium]|nr:glycosyltransferase family 4 protein [Beijerinckiaceae bacterium]
MVAARFQRPIWLLIDSSTIGGIESHVAALCEALIERGQPAEIVLLARHGDNPWLDQLRARSIPFRLLDGRFRTLLGSLRAERPALLHTHGYKAGIVGRLACRLAGLPAVSTFHAGERAAFPVSLYQDIDCWTSRLGVRVAVDETIAAALPSPCHVVRNFIALATPRRADEPARSVAFVGRLSHEKGPDTFCEIAIRSDPGIAFDVYGDGPMRAGLEERYSSRVTFHGLQRDMRTVWPRIGLLLMPSRAEGLPMAALEAMAAGVPLAAARVGGLPSLVEDGATGWLFAPEAMDDACRAVAAWAAQPNELRAAMSRACRETAERRFGPDAPVARLLEIYGEAATRGTTAEIH